MAIVGGSTTIAILLIIVAGLRKVMDDLTKCDSLRSFTAFFLAGLRKLMRTTLQITTRR